MNLPKPLWKRVAVISGVAAFALYILVVLGVFSFTRYYIGVREARLIDIAIPARWDRFQIAKGNHLVGTAFTLVQTGQRREALAFLRSGLARSPSHRAGRLLLAQLLMEVRRPDAARAALLDGLPLHPAEANYAVAVFSFLLSQQEDDLVVRIATTTLGERDSPPAVKRIAALAAATASFHRGRYDAAEDFLGAVPQLASSRDARLLQARAEWERGYRELALVQLRALADEEPSDTESQTELLHRLREQGAQDETRRRSLGLRIARPELVGPRVALLHAYHEQGDHQAIGTEVENIRRDFRRDAAGLVAVANFAANTGNNAVASQLLAHAQAEGLPWEPHALLHVEALIVAREFRTALETIRTLVRDQKVVGERYATLLDSLQAVAYLGLGETDNARAFLVKYLDQPALRAENLIALANRLVAFDSPEHARRILLRAVATDPLNQAALTRLVELDLNLNRVDALAPHLHRLLAMRKPSRDVLRVAQHKLGSDLFLFSADRGPALDAVRAALEASHALRRPQPQRASHTTVR